MPGWLGAAILLQGLFIASSVNAGSNYVVFSGNLMQPVGQTSDFVESGSGLEVRFRHFNRARMAFELGLGYSQSSLGGEISATIDRFKAMTLEKNQLAQQQGGPGAGSITAEFGTLETFFVNGNLIFRPLRRSRLSPILSVGAGLYNWRVPFRIKFNNVPSFGEQKPWVGIEEGSVYALIHPEEIINYTKHETSGGVNAAVGADVRLSPKFYATSEIRVHLIFSSGTGNKELGIDDQDYLDGITFLLLNASLNYRF